jgi:hypothetical protein
VPLGGTGASHRHSDSSSALVRRTVIVQEYKNKETKTVLFVTYSIIFIQHYV